MALSPNKIKLILAIIPVVGAIVVALITHPWQSEVVKSQVTMTSTTSISGTVLDASTGDNISQAEVEIVGYGKRTMTENSGHFKISFPDTIKYITIRVIKTGYKPINQSYETPYEPTFIQLSK